MLEVALDPVPAAIVAGRLSARPGFAFLDSGGGHGELARYSFVAAEPFGTFHVAGGIAFWNGDPLAGDDPLEALRERLQDFRLPHGHGAFPFRGGLIGYIAYDFGRRLERLAEPAASDHGLDEMRFDFYDTVFAFDRVSGRCSLFSSGLPDMDETARAHRASMRAEEALGWLAGPAPLQVRRHSPVAMGAWRSNFTRDAYEKAVSQVRDHIAAGDIYQANIAQRFECGLPEDFDAFAFYGALREANPAPFGAFLRAGNMSIASSSPERFLSCRGGHVEARPIKGTARRDGDPQRDAQIAAALQASEKDRAENIMIVDLLRNDLSRVARPKTVDVPVLCGLETYEGLHHLTSVVTGTLRPGLDCLDLIAATFPGGSITGAPKMRAMDIVTEIEGMARGVYCGTIGYIGFDGDMDMNIAIRTATLAPGRAHFSVGGGVTLLSDPAQEYAETLVKAERLFAAFGGGEGP